MVGFQLLGSRFLDQGLEKHLKCARLLLSLRDRSGEMSIVSVTPPARPIFILGFLVENIAEELVKNKAHKRGN